MSTEIYNFDYEKELQKKSDNFVPLGSINPETNIRSSPIVVPVAVKSAKNVLVKRAERPATTTAKSAIKMPILFRQKSYDYALNRPSIKTSPITIKQDDSDDDWSSIYDDDFRGGKKRSRKARSTRRKRTRNTRSRSTRSKRTKRSSSRRYGGRKGR